MRPLGQAQPLEIKTKSDSVRPAVVPPVSRPVLTPPVNGPPAKPLFSATEPASEERRGRFAASFYASTGYGAAFSASYATSHVYAYGSHPYSYHYGYSPYYSSCYAPYYAPAWYAPVWAGPCHYPTWYGGYHYSYPSYAYYGSSYGGFSYFGSNWRFSVGFGHSYSPYYYRSCYTPFYRRYLYYPYHYYSTVTYYPAYTTVYHENVNVAYSDTSDPYVEYVDDVPAATAVSTVATSVPLAPSGPVVPQAFAEPFVSGFPEGLTPEELLSKGDGWLRSGEYLFAAEAYRRSWLSRPSDDFMPMQVALALFASGGRYNLASFALSESLDRNPEWPKSLVNLEDRMGHPSAYQASLRDLQRHVLKNPRDGEARFLLGWSLYASRNDFAALNEFKSLREGGFESSHLGTLIDEAERRVLDPGTRR